MSTETALTLPQRAAVALGSAQTEKDLQALAAASQAITVITNPDGYKQAQSARMALVRARVQIEQTGKAAREDATKFSKAVIAEEARLIAIIKPEETRLAVMQQAVDDEAERVKQERIAAEQRRVQAIQDQMRAIETLPLSVVNKSADQIRVALDSAVAVVVNEETFAEFTERAGLTVTAVVAKLQLMLQERITFEAEQELLRAQREEQAREAARLEAIRVEQERVAAVEREREADRRRVAQAEQDARDKQERERMAAQQRELAARQAEIAAEERRQAQERQRIEEEAARLAKAQAAPEVAPVAEPQPAPVMRSIRGRASNTTLVDDLLDALRSAMWMLERDFIDEQKLQVIRKCEAALARAQQVAA